MSFLMGKNAVLFLALMKKISNLVKKYLEKNLEEKILRVYSFSGSPLLMSSYIRGFLSLSPRL